MDASIESELWLQFQEEDHIEHETLQDEGDVSFGRVDSLK